MREVDPLQTPRAQSWTLYHRAPMPMVTIFRTVDITNLMNLKQQGYQLNMLLCYCIGAAASHCEQFYLLPAETKMLAYERIGVNAIIANQQGGISSCDIPFDEDLDTFNAFYQMLSEMVRISGKDHEIADHMIVGTSALIRHELDGVVNMYTGIYHNPFLIGEDTGRKAPASCFRSLFSSIMCRWTGWKPVRSSMACSGRSTIWGSKAAACIP